MIVIHRENELEKYALGLLKAYIRFINEDAKNVDSDSYEFLRKDDFRGERWVDMFRYCLILAVGSKGCENFFDLRPLYPACVEALKEALVGFDLSTPERQQDIVVWGTKFAIAFVNDKLPKNLRWM